MFKRSSLRLKASLIVLLLLSFDALSCVTANDDTPNLVQPNLNIGGDGDGDSQLKPEPSALPADDALAPWKATQDPNSVPLIRKKPRNTGILLGIAVVATNIIVIVLCCGCYALNKPKTQIDVDKLKLV
ncbi:hypothetical protein L596_022001 [Steinernema carpocapsae]|uniref:Nematode cuticle collagen N-terminal domain-containing protein n=1 Tax=Steinernema carpocapsae TaxID=34508 RepID=A0A4U5MKG7_STECR|nr:hypothetical protein L596_022001 [Steinernema carpocapsae]